MPKKYFIKALQHMKEGGYNVSSHFNPQQGATMKIVFTFEEISKIIFEYVQDNMIYRKKVDQIEFDLIGDDFCILTNSKAEEDK
jgi:hypothetical protein